MTRAPVSASADGVATAAMIEPADTTLLAEMAAAERGWSLSQDGGLFLMANRQGGERGGNDLVDLTSLSYILAAIRVEGGYRLTGTWSFASGGRHTRLLGAHSNVQNPDGTPHMRHGRPDDRSFIFLRAEAKITDDWYVLGLRGTGSDTYTVEDLFIPDAHAPARDVAEERRESGPLYVIGSTLLYACGFCSVTIGLARHMLDLYIGLARGRQSRSSTSPMAKSTAVQREIGLLEARISAARAFVHEAVALVYDAAAAGKLGFDERVRLRLATTFAMNEATDVSIASFRGAGTGAVFDAGQFERRFRDADAIREAIEALGVELVDAPTGARWSLRP